MGKMADPMRSTFFLLAIACCSLLNHIVSADVMYTYQYQTASATSVYNGAYSGGSSSWVFPDSASCAGSDATSTTIVGLLNLGLLLPQPSRTLRVTKFGFTVPANATIDGVQIKISKR